jgi:hypothetical protein
VEPNDTFYSRQKVFIDALRKEASDAKACVTQYSFQCLAISGAALGFILNSSKDNQLASLASIPIILLLMIMARIAIYKYEIANRAYGYELYIKSTATLADNDEILFKEEVTPWRFTVYNEHWEQTFHVWRHISPMLFKKFYQVNYYESPFSLLNPNGYKPKFKNKPWILVPKRIDTSAGNRKENSEETMYFPGSYLNNILMMLILMQSLLITPLIIAIFKKLSMIKRISQCTLETFTNISPEKLATFFFEIIRDKYFFQAVIFLSLMLLVIGIIWIRSQRIGRRRQILEGEFFSIRTCSITWDLVNKIHFASSVFAKHETIELLKSNSLSSSSIEYSIMTKYEKNLSLCADLIYEKYDKPDEWNLVQHLESIIPSS